MDSIVVVALINAAVTFANLLITTLGARKKKLSAHEQAMADGEQCLCALK